MRRWALIVLGLGAMGSLLGALVTSVAPDLAMVTAVISFVVSLLIVLTTLRMIGPLTRTAWYAEDSGDVMVMFHYDDLVIKPIVPDIVGPGLLKFKVGRSDVIYHVHPRSVMTVAGSGAKIVWAYAHSPITIPPEYIAVAYDLKNVYGYPSLSAFLHSTSSVEELEAMISELDNLLGMLRSQDKTTVEEARKAIGKIWGEDFTKLPLDELIKMVSGYRGELIETLKHVRSTGSKHIIPYYIRSYTPEDVKSWLPALAPPTALTNVFEYAKTAALAELRLFSGLGARIPWIWLILAGVILLLLVLALPHIQSLIQGGGGVIGGIANQTQVIRP